MAKDKKHQKALYIAYRYRGVGEYQGKLCRILVPVDFCGSGRCAIEFEDGAQFSNIARGNLRQEPRYHWTEDFKLVKKERTP